MEDRLAVVAVHPGGQTLRQEEGGRVLQETGPHTGRQLLQEEGSELTPDRGQALLGGTVISDSNIFSVRLSGDTTGVWRLHQQFTQVSIVLPLSFH